MYNLRVFSGLREFKSPSPHHIKSRCITLIRRLLSFGGQSLSAAVPLGFASFCDVVYAKLTARSLARNASTSRPAAWVSL